MAVDALHAANWQRGGGKSKRPKPIPRPGRGDVAEETTQRLGVAMSIEDYRRRMHPEEFDDIVDAPEPQAPPEEVTVTHVR